MYLAACTNPDIRVRVNRPLAEIMPELINHINGINFSLSLLYRSTYEPVYQETERIVSQIQNRLYNRRGYLNSRYAHQDFLTLIDTLNQYAPDNMSFALDEAGAALTFVKDADHDSM